MPSISKPFRLVAPGTAFAYGVLMMPLAHAQNAPITPVLGDPVRGATPTVKAPLGTLPGVPATAPVAPATAPVPVPVAPLPAPNARPRIEKLDFKDVAVAELLTMLSQQFDVKIIVTDDVVGNIKYINLSNLDAEDAIKQVAMATGLQYRVQDGTYIVGKNLPPDPTAPTPGILPITPGNPTIVPGGSLALGPNQPLPGFGSTPVDANGLPILSGTGNGYDFNGINLDGNTNKNRGSQTAIKIKNVKASLLAYWIDPRHHELPIEFKALEANNSNYGKQNPGSIAVGNEAQTILNSSALNSLANGMTAGGVAAGFNPYIQNRASGQMMPEVQANAQFGGGGGGNRGGGGGGLGGRGGGGGGLGGGGGQGGQLDLPGDIEQILAVDAQNILLVQGGTEEDLRKLQDIINVLDRPLRQVEIEAQFVQVTTTDTRNFGIDFTTSQGNFDANTVGLAPQLAASSGGFQVGFVRGNFQATLSALINRNRAKVLTAPRVTAINNLTASIYSTTQTPVVLSQAVSGGGVGGGTATGQNLIYISTSIGLSVTPTINNDDTITVLMQPQLSTQTPGSASVLGAPSITTQQLFTVANVRDGDTIALGGLRLKQITRGGSRIPVLGDIPLIGKLFQSRDALDNDNQLIIFLRANIIRRFGDDEAVPGA